MSRHIAALALLATLSTFGCSSQSSPTAPIDDRIVSVDGPLTFTVSDFPVSMGILWIQPTAEGGHGVVTARAIRYGSLCMFAVTGRADVVGSRVDLHVAFEQRPAASCTNEARAIQYDAAVNGLAPGRYEVHILHSNDATTGEVEVRVQSVDVS